MHYVSLALGGFLLLVIAVFSLQNLAAVDVSFLVWSFAIPKSLLIVGSYLLGMVSGWGLVELVKMMFRQ